MVPLFGDATTVASSLASQVTAGNMWAAIDPFAVLIGTLVIIAFGITIVRRVVKGASKGKAKL